MSLTEAQLIYLQEVLGLQGVVLPREIPVAVPEAGVSSTETPAIQAQPHQAVSTSSVSHAPSKSPSGRAEFRTSGDLAASALVCLFWTEEGAAWPLEGASGELARKMIQAMKLSEEDVTWVEWKSQKGQRAPDEILEMVASAGFRPVICFGDAALTAVTGAAGSLGQWQDWQGVQLMPTHSLPELLAKAALKRPAWAHLQMVMKVM